MLFVFSDDSKMFPFLTLLNKHVPIYEKPTVNGIYSNSAALFMVMLLGKLRLDLNYDCYQSIFLLSVSLRMRKPLVTCFYCNTKCIYCEIHQIFKTCSSLLISLISIRDQIKSIYMIPNITFYRSTNSFTTLFPFFQNTLHIFS